MKEKAQMYFGTYFSGLCVDRCSYSEFKTWYEITHEMSCNIDIYEIACYIWNNYTKR